MSSHLPEELSEIRSSEYQSLRQELLNNEKYVLLKIYVYFAAFSTAFIAAFKEDVTLASILPSIFIILLYFHSKDTKSKHNNNARIASYISLVHEPGGHYEWIGWENALIEYRKIRNNNEYVYDYINNKFKISKEYVCSCDEISKSDNARLKEIIIQNCEKVLPKKCIDLINNSTKFYKSGTDIIYLDRYKQLMLNINNEKKVTLEFKKANDIDKRCGCLVQSAYHRSEYILCNCCLKLIVETKNEKKKIYNKSEINNPNGPKIKKRKALYNSLISLFHSLTSDQTTNSTRLFLPSILSANIFFTIIAFILSLFTTVHGIVVDMNNITNNTSYSDVLFLIDTKLVLKTIICLFFVITLLLSCLYLRRLHRLNLDPEMIHPVPYNTAIWSDALKKIKSKTAEVPNGSVGYTRCCQIITETSQADTNPALNTHAP